MTTENVTMWYFIIGIVYAFINGYVRKLDTDGDYLLPFVWVTIWPLGIVSLLISGAVDRYKKFVGKPD